MIDPAHDSLYLNHSKAQDAAKPQESLGKDDFLQLLVTQLQNQDPSEPMENKEFISQMATFSSLEQMQNMNDSMEKFLKDRQNNLLSKNAQLIGKQVTWQAKDDDEGQQHEGLIQSVRLKVGEVQFETETGTTIDRDQLTSVGMPGADDKS